MKEIKRLIISSIFIVLTSIMIIIDVYQDNGKLIFDSIILLIWIFNFTLYFYESLCYLEYGTKSYRVPTDREIEAIYLDQNGNRYNEGIYRE